MTAVFRAREGRGWGLGEHAPVNLLVCAGHPVDGKTLLHLLAGSRAHSGTQQGVRDESTERRCHRGHILRFDKQTIHARFDDAAGLPYPSRDDGLAAGHRL